MATIGLIAALVGGTVIAAFIDGANEEENRKKWDAMSPSEQEFETKFWDRMMQ